MQGHPFGDKGAGGLPFRQIVMGDSVAPLEKPLQFRLTAGVGDAMCPNLVPDLEAETTEIRTDVRCAGIASVQRAALRELLLYDDAQTYA